MKNESFNNKSLIININNKTLIIKALIIKALIIKVTFGNQLK